MVSIDFVKDSLESYWRTVLGLLGLCGLFWGTVPGYLFVEPLEISSVSTVAPGIWGIFVSQVITLCPSTALATPSL